jgi:hypothetical protein
LVSFSSVPWNISSLRAVHSLNALNAPHIGHSILSARCSSVPTRLGSLVSLLSNGKGKSPLVHGMTASMPDSPSFTRPKDLIPTVKMSRDILDTLFIRCLANPMWTPTAPVHFLSLEFCWQSFSGISSARKGRSRMFAQGFVCR